MTTFPAAALAASLAVALSGCAAPAPSNQAMLTLDTRPAGATLYEGQLALGVGPVTRTYQSEGGAGLITTPAVTAVWPSGAKASFWTRLPVGADRVATIDRPERAPGLERDLAHALQFTAAKTAKDKKDAETVSREAIRNSGRCLNQRASGHVSPDCG